jgi:hypothetical protein
MFLGGKPGDGDGTNTTPALNRHEVNIPSVQPFPFLSRNYLGFKTVTAYLWDSLICAVFLDFRLARIGPYVPWPVSGHTA